MKIVSLGLAVTALLVLGTNGAGAQMVVSPNLGERVDYPFYSDDGQRLHFHHRYTVYRHSAHHHPRFIILQAAFPTPQPFGWSNCCQ